MDYQQAGLPGAADHKGLARASTIMGILMLICWIIPFVGLPLGAIGLILGIVGLGSSRRDLARAGLFLNGLGLGLTAVNLIVSAYLLLDGQLDLFDLLP